MKREAEIKMQQYNQIVKEQHNMALDDIAYNLYHFIDRWDRYAHKFNTF